jgi:hypothetical protein
MSLHFEAWCLSQYEARVREYVTIDTSTAVLGFFFLGGGGRLHVQL